MDKKNKKQNAETQKVDMHVHTAYSYDGFLTLEDMDAACLRKGITGVVVSDHNEIDGALRADELHRNGSLKTRIIVGEEISTAQGEIIGLFLEKRIPPGMSMAETIAAIREQNGLVYLNHPFGYSKRSTKLQIDDLDDLWDKIDIVEVFNGRNRDQISNKLALELAKMHHKPGGVGTDAHSPWEVGRSFVQMAGFKDNEEFLVALRNAKYACRPCPFSYRIAFKARKVLLPKPRVLKLAS